MRISTVPKSGCGRMSHQTSLMLRTVPDTQECVDRLPELVRVRLSRLGSTAVLGRALKVMDLGWRQALCRTCTRTGSTRYF